MIDAHAHADFVTDPHLLGTELLSRGITVVAQSVLPSRHEEMMSIWGGEPTLLPSLGFHPWYLTGDVTAELDIFERLVSTTRFIGEIGLDYSPARLEAVPAERQEQVLRDILAIVAHQAADSDKPYVMSLHAVRSAGRVLDLLESVASDLLGDHIIPIFHRFSGTSQDLTRLRQAGGAISVHPSTLASKKGRAYVRQCERLLVESDLPEAPGADAGQVASAIAESLTSTLDELEKLGRDPASIAAESSALFGAAW